MTVEYEPMLRDPATGDAYFASERPSAPSLAVVPPTGRGLRVVTAGDFLEEPETVPDWLVADLLPRVGLAILAGDPKSFKSLLALQVAVGVASRDVGGVLGREVGHGPVLFILEEGSRHKLRDRLRAMLRGLGIRAVPDLHFVLFTGVRLDNEASMRDLEATIAAVRPVLVVLDPLAALHGAGESRPDEMARVIRPLGRLAARYEFLALVIHHVTKPQADRKATRLAQRIRGAGELAAATDANVIVDREGDRARIRAEYRDAEPVETWIAFDAVRFVLEESEPPDRPGPAPKITDEVAIAYVAKVGTGVTVNGAATAWGVSRSTAWGRLHGLAERGRVELREERSAAYFYPVEVSE